MKIRSPIDQLVDCYWLPRFIDKARLRLAGELPVAYRLTFGSPVGIDGYFLRFFQIRKRDVLTVIKDSGSTDESIGGWFLAQPMVTSQRIAEWNAFAPRIGEKGYPGYWTFPLVKRIVYPKAVANPVKNFFEAIIQDERE